MNLKVLLTEETLQHKVSELQERLGIETTWPDTLVDYMYNLLKRDVSLHDDSHCRFIYVLHQAVFHNNYDMLTRSAISSNPENDEGKKCDKSDVKRPLSKRVIDIIIRRKMRNAKYKENVSLPLFPGNLKSLQMSRDFVKLQSADKHVVNLVFNVHQNTSNMKNNISVTKAVAAGNNLKSVSKFCIALKQLASKQQHEMDLQHRANAERFKMRKLRRLLYKLDTLDEDNKFDDLVTNLKDDLTDNYNKKKGSQKRNHSSNHQSALLGGHCLNCMKPFHGLHVKTTEDRCRYHPGYIYFNFENNRDKWTCCDSEALDERPTVDDHSQNGCNYNDNHVWRPHKKASRKPGVNHKEKSVGDMAKKLINQNSSHMDAYKVMNKFNAYY